MVDEALYANGHTMTFDKALSWTLLLLTLGSLISLPAMADGYPELQPLIDAAEENSTLVLPPGTYAGPVYINKPLIIDGENKVTIDAGGKGSVIYVDSDGTTIRNLHLTNSGNSHNDIDAGVQVRGNFNVIKDNVIDNCLFGVDLQQSEFNIVRRNTISSKDVELGVRGDAIRLWYSFNNKITDNIIRNSRDMVVWYSRDNIIAHNDARYGRYSLHFMYSQYNVIEENHFTNNSVGIFLMYSDGVVLRNNYVAHAVGPTGVGVGMKETSDITLEGNQLLYNAHGISLDVSPYQPESKNYIKNNLIAYNNIGVRFLNDWTGNVFSENRFKSNITPIAVGDGASAQRNEWEVNYWDAYEGFDTNNDGIGDTPHELYSYADRIWMDVPPAQFFKGSPILEVIDFLERLAPFTEPTLVLRDTRPLLAAEVVQ